jgi:proline racemase
VDGEGVGIPIDSAHAPQLIDAAGEITHAIEHSLVVIHPAETTLTGLHGVIFTGPARTAADLRSATVLQTKVLKRSPGVAGTCALLAVLDAMGLVDAARPFTHEGLVETILRARVIRRDAAGDVPTVVSRVEGSAWVTGRHEFEADDADPVKPFEIG